MGNPPAAGAPRRRCCAIQGLVVLFLVYVLAVLVLAGGELFRDDDQLDLRFPSSPGIGSSSSARVLLSPRSLVLRLGEITRRGGTRWWWTGGDRPESDSPTSDGGKGTNSSATEACSRRCAATGLMGMSLRLAKQLSANAEDDGAGNLVFSPLSIYSALTVVTAGARGTTLDELLGVPGAPSRDTLTKNAGEIVRALPGGTATGGPRVVHACGLWHERTTMLKPAFRAAAAAAAASFNAAARAVDFLTNPEEARKEINSWVATATENLIDTILPPGSVGTFTRIVVTSAIYFNGTWQTPFLKQKTKKYKFHLLDGSGAVDADFMRSGDDQYIAAHDGFKVLKMPYAHAAPQPAPHYSMYILLPDKRDGLSSLEEMMAAGSGGGEGFLREHMPERRVEVGEFRIPRFKLAFDRSVVRALRGVGVNAMFDRAELPDMLEGEPLFVSDVLHKAVVEVNEEGTEAAAATAIIMKGMARRSSPAPVPVDFVADHPFAFLVVEESSGAVLFAGHVVDPTKS